MRLVDDHVFDNHSVLSLCPIQFNAMYVQAQPTIVGTLMYN